MAWARQKINRLLSVATIVALTALAGVLAYIESSYRGEINHEIESVARAFGEAGELQFPTNPSVDFPAIEGLAAGFRMSPRIAKLRVVKRVQIDGRPPWAPIDPCVWLEGPDSGIEELETWRRADIILDGEIGGAVFFQLNSAALVWIRASIALAVLLIAGALGALVWQVFRQERVLTTTSEILEQNRRELIRMERLSLAGQLSANIFHDIRKPVTNIKHEMTDLAEALGDFAGATRALRNMRDQVDLFFDILRDLNIERFVRSDGADEEFVDVNRAIEQALQLVRYERGATRIKATLEEDLPLVSARPYRLVQVFSNLILNAYQAVEGRGELSITTCATPLDSPSSTPGREEGDRVFIEIADDGPGIAEEYIDLVFSPFFSTKPADKGSGLGLYICRTIVEEMGGTLHARSGEGNGGAGTRFNISLPAGE